MQNPRQIGRYNIVAEIGRGGMATVYLARDPRFQRDVAIKVLPRQFTHEPRFLERFEREAQTIAALEHPAIVPVYDFGEFEDTPYLVMRYMAGGSLRPRIADKPLPLTEISRIFDRLAPAMDKAHARGVIHRDLKMDNVLFDDDNLPYLADFGIARLAEATQTMTIVGTPAYMSPEQVQGDQKLDGRSDVYALGVMLFEMLTGHRPYKADTPTKQMLKHILEPIPDVMAANPHLPEGTQDVVNRAMAKERDARYSTAAELATAVSSLINSPEEQASYAPITGASAVVAAAYGEAATIVDTPPEFKTAVTPQKGSKLPAWVWWIGALLLLLLLVWGISVLMGGNVESDVAGTQTAVALAVLPTSTLTPQPTTEPSPTPLPTAVPTSTLPPTPTVDPNIPPIQPNGGDVWMRPIDTMPMVYAPPGTFLMGSSADQIAAAFDFCEQVSGAGTCNRAWFADEGPQSELTLGGFWLDQTEVTNAQFNNFVQDSGYTTIAEQVGGGNVYIIGEGWQLIEGANWQFPLGPGSNLDSKDDHPVVMIAWEDAEAYCTWAGGQLPTEAQWEYAAKGPENLLYPWGNDFDGSKLNFCDVNCPFDWKDANSDDGYAFTAPVGSYPAGSSWIGALDMAGNVFEWVRDWYADDYYANAPVENPLGPDQGERRGQRGGSWLNPLDRSIRTAERDSGLLGDAFNKVGLRCVKN